MTQVVLMEDYLDFARSLPCVQALAGRVKLTIHTSKAQSLDELRQRLADADIVITIRDRVRFDANVLNGLARLRLISVCGPRVDHIDLDAARRAGVTVCAPPKTAVAWSVHYATAEANWGIILAMMKDICLNQDVLRSGGWQTRLSRDLYGKTLGIVGLGKIGSLVAQMARCMGMQVMAWGPRLTHEAAAAQGVQYAPLEQVLKGSDILSLHANLTSSSEHIIGAEQLAMMKPSALLINTARAGLVEESALRNALDNSVIAGAGLDVYWHEPLPPRHWLRAHPKVLIQPHIGGFSEDGYRDLIEPAVENAIAFLDGRPKDVILAAG